MKFDLSKLKLRFSRKEKTPNPANQTPNAQLADEPTPQSSKEGPPATSDKSHQSNPQIPSGTRNGKVARLPVEVRETVNRMLENGTRFKDIVKHLDELGYPGIHDFNISRWRTGGYQDWLASNERLACARIRADSVRDLIREIKSPDELSLGAQILTATQMYDSLLAAPAPGTPEFDKHVKTVNTLGRTLCGQMAETTRRDRIAFEKQRHTDKMQLADKQAIYKERQKRDLNDPLTHEETVSIVHKVDQLFGIQIEPDPAYIPPQSSTAMEPAKPETALDSQAPHSALRTPHSAAPICTDLNQSAPPQPAPFVVQALACPKTALLTIADPKPEAPQSPKIPHSELGTPHSESQPPCSVPVGPCSVRVTPEPKSTTDAPTPADIQNDKLQLTNYQLQIAEAPDAQIPHSGAPLERVGTPHSEPARVPISPLAATQIPNSAVRARKFSTQPPGTIPMFDVCGALVDWIPQSAPCPEIFDIVGFQNRRGKYICWVHPNDPYRDPANPEPNPRRSAILNVNGLIIGWHTGYPDVHRPPSPTAEPINSRKFRHGLVAWMDERA